jgi:hypothetical protein
MSNQKPDLEYILTKHFEGELKSTIANNIINAQLQEFESKIRPIVEKECEKLTLQSVQHYLDALKNVENVAVYLKWS